MKNQYIGDIGDFGKYALLRAFAEAGVKVGINWYLTTNDGSNDGKFTKYLDDERMRRRAPEVFDVLKSVAGKKDKSVKDIQNSGIIKDAVFFDELMSFEGNPPRREYLRGKWFSRSKEVLKDTELIFLDPDNGLLESDDASKLNANKYVLPEEVEQYFSAGHNVVYYCHKGRRSYDLWEEYKGIMFGMISSAKSAILTYHKGTQRSYIFLIHEESFVNYREIIDKFLRDWYKIFSEEYLNGKNPANEVFGEKITVTKSNGSVVTVENRADGRIQIKSSVDPNTTHIMTADMFCGFLRI